jgi:hypothetical protein
MFCLAFGPLGLPAPVRELRFAPPRRWRFDYAWPELFVAVEKEGGVYTRGRHTRGAGYADDMEKYNAATRLGWALFRYQPRHLLARLPEVAEFIRRRMATHRGEGNGRT